MVEFSIYQVEAFTGIKAGTLRIWEKRYDICTPNRFNGKNRRYSLEELELIMNIALLNRNGYKISKLATFTPDVIKQKAGALTHIDDVCQNSINQLILYSYSADAEKFEILLDYCFSIFGVDKTIKDIILVFLQKINLMSYTRTTVDAHLTTTTLRKKLIYYIESLQPRRQLNKTALLFLPTGEHFDLMLLYMLYIIKSAGMKTIYLGTNANAQTIAAVMQKNDPDYLFTYQVPQGKFNVSDIITYLSESLPQKNLTIVGASENLNIQIQQPNVRCIHYNQLDQWLQSA